MAKIFAVTIVRDRNRFGDSHRDAHVADAGGYLHSRPSDRRAVCGYHVGGGNFVPDLPVLLAFFIWKFSNPKPGDKIKSFPGGANGHGIAAFLLVGTEVLALGVFGVKGMGQCLSHASRGECDAGAGASRTVRVLLPLSRPGWKFGPIHPDLISEANAEFLRPGHRPTIQDSKDDIVTAEMAIPVNREDPSAHACEGRRTFLLRSGIARAAGFCSRAGLVACISRRQRSASTKSSARSYAASATTT